MCCWFWKIYEAGQAFEWVVGRAAERIGEAEGKYKKWGLTKWIM